jgi:type IV pilus assembly protein PilC
MSLKLTYFKFSAKHRNGKLIKGHVEAIDRQICHRFLVLKGYEVIEIKEQKNILTNLSSIKIGKTFQTRDIIFFLKQMGSLLKAGIHLVTALEMLAIQQEKKAIRSVYFEIYHHVYNGYSFSKALMKMPSEFPGLMVQMIEVGEISGDLPDTMLQLATYYENQQKTINDIKQAMRMPIIYLIAAVLISIGMLMFVFPNISSLYDSFEGAVIPPITQFFLDVGTFMEKNALLIIGGITGISITIAIMNKYSKGAHRFFTYLGLKTPIVGSLIRMNNQILIANALSQMLSHGIHALKALQTLVKLVNNVIYKELIVKTIAYIEDGNPFYLSFSESEFIDQIMVKMIQTGEQSGDIPKVMNNLAQYYNGISEMKVNQIKNAIQPILLIIVYAIVGVMILAIMLPMLSLGTQI